MNKQLAAIRHPAFDIQDWPPSASLTYDTDGIPWGLLPQEPDYLLVARLDILHEGEIVFIEHGSIGHCSCDEWTHESPYCQHVRLAKAWVRSRMPSAIRSADALAADARADAQDGHPAKALRLLGLAERLATPYAVEWADARTVLDACESSRNIMAAMSPGDLA